MAHALDVTAPVDNVLSSDTGAPICTALALAWMAALTCAVANSPPVTTTSLLPTPPLLVVTIASDGGTATFGTVQVELPALSTVGATPGYPASVRFAAGSPDCPVT